MKKIFIALSLALASCTTNPFAAPAPCSVSAVDEKGLVLALETFDTTLTAVDRLIAAKVIVPGSPRAIQIADAISAAKTAYQAASAAQKVCNTTSYLTAIGQAQIAVARINQLIKGN